MPSRDPRDLHPELFKRWVWMADQWEQEHPDDPQPFLTCTYRPMSEQQALVDAGKSRAKPGQSLHGFLPALAFDVAFLRPDGQVTWEFHWFQLWGELAESIGLEWGGRWPHLVDGPHVQWPVTWQQAQTGGPLSPLPPLPTPHPLLPLYSEANELLGTVTVVDDRKAYIADELLERLRG